MKQIKVNVTNARKNLFSLINSVATGNIEVIITKNEKLVGEFNEEYL